MMHVRVLKKYIHFELMYSNDHIFSLLPMNYLVDQDGELTTPHKLAN